MPEYSAPIRDIQFVLHDVLQVGASDVEGYGDLDPSFTAAILEEAGKVASEVLAPLNRVGDEQGCRLENGVVRTPEGFDRAFQAMKDGGWNGLDLPEEFGGQNLPYVLGTAVGEVFVSANMAFNMYQGLTHGAISAILAHGTDAQKAAYVPKMTSLEWTGTMNLTEPHAGTDLGMIRTRAEPQDDGSYRITGQKIFISAGDHDLAENVVHLVLARIEGAPTGTKGLSLFMVPKIWVHEDGALGEPNDVVTASIEHKLGIKSSATAVLNFGENGACRGILVGGQPHQGMKQMFRMMNGARIAVGVQGLSIASTAYLNALTYARERKQGSSIRHFKDPDAPRVPIIEHSDVRRMLLEMKARVEGMRTLAIKLALHVDLAHALHGVDEAKARHHQGQVDLLTPIIKAYCSDQAFRIAEMAIQIYGGAGYVQDNPVEQYCRDAKIFSIYEGTNHIQALDLVSRKLNQHGGENFRAFLDDIKQFVAAHSLQPGIGAEVRALGEAAGALEQATVSLMEFFMSGKIDQVSLVANTFLEAMSEVTIAYLLLEAALIAEQARDAEEEELEEETPRQDVDFYTGKVMAAKFFVNRVLPTVHAKVTMLTADDRSALDMPDTGFSSAY